MEEEILTLQIGDLITLKDLKLDSFLTAEGILLEDVSAAVRAAYFDDNIFMVVLQRQYSASRELDDFMEQLAEHPEIANDASTLKYKAALERGRDNENILNESYLAQKMCASVVFGDIIQLLHVKSGRFLTVMPGNLAKVERENLSVMLTPSGNSMSWLQMMPRYKIDREGDVIKSGTEVFLKAAERTNEFIHLADKDPTPGTKREVNCSLESSSLSLNIFQSSTVAQDAKVLLASNVVQIQDPETQSNLTIPVKGEGAIDDDDDDEGGDDEEQELEADLGESIAEAHVYEDVITVKSKGDFVNTNSLWIIELPNREVGGTIAWRTDSIRFRHLNSGKYLTMLRDKEGSRLHFCDDSSDPNTLFTMHQIYNAGNDLLNNKPLQLAQDGEWLKRGPVHDTLDGFTMTTTDDQASSVNVLFVRLDDKAAGSDEPLDLHVTIAAREYFNKYLDFTVVPDGDSVNTLWPGTQRSDMEFYVFMCKKLSLFLQGYPISADLNGIVNLSDTTKRAKRQAIFRQQGIIQVILMLVDRLIPVSKMLDVASADPTTKKKGMSENMLALKRMATKVLSNALTVLYEVILDHPVNQMYVADFMPVLLAHLNNQPMAGKCVTEMLGKNMELQETKIGTREIGIFVDKLRRSGMNKMYLELLQSCCSCQGKGVDGNQCKVADMVLGDISDIIIQVHADNSKLTPIPWGVGGLYIPSAPIAGQKIFGEDLLHKGLPALALSWTTSSIELSPLGLFGKLSVPIEELYRAADAKNIDEDDWLSNPGRAKKSDGAGTRQKEVISEYFIAEMYLGAEMCLDRNYVAMHKLDALFPFETLVTMLRLEVDDKLKAAAVRLLLCLHIDRDPQSVSKIPCLTRAWSEVSSAEDIQLPYVEPGRRSQFCLVSDVIKDHVAGMKDSRWTLLSQEMLQMLHQMVRFNFYGTGEKVKNVIDPLVDALDRRRMTVEEASEKSKPSLMRQDSADSVVGASPGPTPGASRQSSQKYLQGADDEEGEDELGDFRGEHPEGEVEKEKEPTWQMTTLEFMESTQVLLVILGLVVVATTLLVLETLEIVDGQLFGPLWFINLSIFAVFVFEFLLRCYCFHNINGHLFEYIGDKFNTLDLCVILIDTIFLIMDLFITMPEGAGFAKTLRIARAARFARMLRMARVLDKLHDNFTTSYGEYKAPMRFVATPVHEIKTMVEAVEILAYVQKIVDDRNLSIFLRKFHEWDAGKDTRAPPEIFRSDVMKLSKEVCMGGEDLNSVFIDVLMFNDEQLVQGALDIIVATNSTIKRLIHNASKVQLLVSSKRERQFKLIDQMLLQLERNAETQELWGCLETVEDRTTSKQTYEILYELIDSCRNRRDILEFDEEFAPDMEIQNLLRNLGCFDICFKVFDLMETIEEEPDGSLAEEHQNTKDIVTLCSELMYWFLLDNPDNQELAFEELDFFLEGLDDEIKFHHIVKAIFKNNERLMRLCSHSFLEDMVDKIIKNGKKPEYLSIMTAISHVGELNIVSNQFEIIKQLASPSRLPKLMCFLCPVDHVDYIEKVGLMEPFANVRDVKVDELPPKLAYHLMFMEVLSGCTVGRINITTVEAKVQSIFDFKYILEAILDPRSIIIAKVRMGLYFFNAVVEVEMTLAGLETNAKMWDLLMTAPPIFAAAKDELRLAEKYGWDYEGVSRQRIEYFLVMVMIVGGFFERYYSSKIFKNDDNAKSALPDHVALTSQEGEDLIADLFQKIKDVYDMDCLKLSSQHKGVMFSALLALNKSAKKVIVASIDATHEGEKKADDDEGVGQTQEERVHESYQKFIALLEADDDLKFAERTEAMSFISSIEALPFLNDRAASDVRYEPFIRKLVSHVRGRLTVVNGENRLDNRCTRSTTWLIGALRTMIENVWGMDIDERDGDGGDEQDEASAPITHAFNTCGVTALCLDLIAVGIDDDLQAECVKLCTCMLFKEGGAKKVQKTMFDHLNGTNSELFFRQMKVSIQKVISWHKWNGVVILEEDEDPDLPEAFRVIRFLQLMSEGHFEPNQDIVREQPNNPNSYNLLDDMVIMANTLSRLPCKTSTASNLGILNLILEVIQGPCVKNQAHYALNTELIETLNRLMRSKSINDCDEADEIDMKKTVVDIFQGLLEGQGRHSPVYERVLSVIHLDIIQILAEPTADGEVEVQDPENEEEMVLLKTECLVLLQMLFDYRPALREELGMEELDELPEGVACVEVLWRGDLQRRFFHVPDVCGNLAKASMDALVEEVDRSNQENKLLDFLFRAQELYREVMHQEWLNNHPLKLSLFFSNQILNQATWLTFLLTISINSIFVGFYTWADGGDTPTMNEDARLAVTILNICQATSALYVVILTLVVRTPVKYETHKESGLSSSWALLAAFSDWILLYYIGFLGVCLAGIFVDWTTPLLLLDIIKKNSTTRDVLNAVVYPRKQLGMTVVLGAFILYIFAFFIFYYFRDKIDIEDDGADEDRIDFCANLWDCFLTVTSYGMRCPEGMGGFMDHDLGERWILDFLYFVVVLIVLLNVIFGIIIDTFSDLRSQKQDKITDTNEICFICGIDKQVFDRASDKPNGFQEHIKKDHNMWAYLYFIIFVWEQDKDDDDGMELYVRNCIEEDDLSWFPMNKAMRLDGDEDDGEELIRAVKDELDTVQVSLADKLEMLKTEMSGSLEQLSVAVKQLNGGGAGGRGLSRGQSRSAVDSAGGSGVGQAGLGATTTGAIHVQVQEVSGVNLAPDELNNASVTLRGELGSMTIEADRVSGSKILFAPEAYSVGGTFTRPPGHLSITLDVGSVRGSLELSETDLRVTEETRVMKTFTLEGQSAMVKLVMTLSQH